MIWALLICANRKPMLITYYFDTFTYVQSICLFFFKILHVLKAKMPFKNLVTGSFEVPILKMPFSIAQGAKNNLLRKKRGL